MKTLLHQQDESQNAEESISKQADNICPRILVLSHNSFSNVRNNGKTLSALFGKYPKDKLAQFYIQNEIPGFNICMNYFQMTDLDILYANIKFTVAKGKVIVRDDKREEENDNVYISLEDLKGWKRLVYTMLYNRQPLAELAREVAWRKSKWQSSELISWLDQYKPQAVFALSSHTPFFNKIIQWVCERYEIPLFLFSTDDYTFLSSITPIAYINQLRHMRQFKKILISAKKFYAISPAMKEEYSAKFGCKNVGTLINCVPPKFGDADDENTLSPQLRILYAGGLHLNRWKVLCTLADCLDNMRTEGYNAILDIYCSTKPTTKILNKFEKYETTKYKSSLNSAELAQEISKSNVLVHVESFDKKNVKATRLSISTKIPEYMTSNRMILAIGPKNIASMSYLEQHEIGLCINSKNKSQIINKLKEFIFDETRRRGFAERAKSVASQHYNMEEIQQGLYSDLLNLSLN